MVQRSTQPCHSRTDQSAGARRRWRRTAAVAALTLVTVGLPLTAAASVSPGGVVVGFQGVVTTESPLASEAGLAVLEQGGNAVDAAVAAAFAMGVVRFDTCGIGGGGFLVYRRADGHVDTVDFFERAPGKGGTYTPRVNTSSSDPADTEKGRALVGVPGFVAGMAAALDKYGSKGLRDVIAPSIQYARNGFPISPHSASAIADHWKYQGANAWNSDTYLIYYNGIPKKRGEILTLPDYASTLERIAENGPAEFYDVAGKFETATRLLRDLQSTPGDPTDFTARDLQEYQAYWREPVVTRYRGSQIVGMGGPSAGGTLIAEALNILQGFDLAAMPPDEQLHVTLEAQRIAWADRRAYYGDPGPPGQTQTPDDAWADIPPQLLTRNYAAKRREQIATGPSGLRREIYEPGTFPGYTPWTGESTGSPGTTGLSVIDKDGNAVAMSCSLGGHMGSGVTPRGLGFLLNHSLSWDAKGSPNAPAAGKAPRSAQSPTIVTRDGVLQLVVGGKGGSTIPMGVLNTVLHTIDRGLSLDKALDAPRIDCCGFDRGGTPYDYTDDHHPNANAAHAETRTENEDALKRLAERGHKLTLTKGYAKAPILQAAAVDPTTGAGQSASDPRGECGPSSVDFGARNNTCWDASTWLHEWARTPSKGGWPVA